MTAQLKAPAKLSVKQRLKVFVQRLPFAWNLYWQLKQSLLRTLMLRYHLADAKRTWRDMRWPVAQTEQWRLSAELLFNYHKLEKGLVMPGKRRFFGAEPAERVMQLANRWRELRFPEQEPIYQGAIDTLRSYLQCLTDQQLDPEDRISTKVDAFIQEHAVRASPSIETPVPVKRVSDPVLGLKFLRELLMERRSVRAYLPTPVSTNILMDAIRDAQQAPSACNRQPCTVMIVSDPSSKAELLSLQNGNRGFGHLAPHIGVIMSDASGFFDASERHQTYVDGGLFTMALLLSFQARGVSTCCLNWCVSPEIDDRARRLLKLAPSKRIIMLLALGYAPSDIVAPASPRRQTSDIAEIK